MKKILVPVDDFELSKKLAKLRKIWASKYDSDIILITVVPGMTCRSCGLTTFPMRLRVRKKCYLKSRKIF